MRLKIIFEKTNNKISIDNIYDFSKSYLYQKLLITDKKIHGKVSNFSISPLCGGLLNKETRLLSFKNNPYIIISSNELSFMNKIMMELINKPKLNGFNFNKFEFVSGNFINGWNDFLTLSPILIKKRLHEKTHKKDNYFTFNDESFLSILKERTIKKLLSIDNTLDLSNFDINFKDSKIKKIRKVKVNNIVNYANSTKLTINCKKNVAELLYNVGLGGSTNIGFGVIYKPENYDKIYKF